MIRQLSLAVAVLALSIPAAAAAPKDEATPEAVLNDLFMNLQKHAANGVTGPAITVDVKILRQINVIYGSNQRGDIGSIRRGADIDWPKALTSLDFEGGRKSMRTLLPKALEQAKKDSVVDAAILKDLTASVDGLLRQLADQVQDLPANEYIESKRFLNRLRDGVKLLGDPDVSRDLRMAEELGTKNRSVAELVQLMTEKGMQFAPPMTADIEAYRELTKLISAYLKSVSEK